MISLTASTSIVHLAKNCEKTLRLTGGTSNLKRHLERVHPEINFEPLPCQSVQSKLEFASARATHAPLATPTSKSSCSREKIVHDRPDVAVKKCVSTSEYENKATRILARRGRPELISFITIFNDALFLKIFNSYV